MKKFLFLCVPLFSVVVQAAPTPARGELTDASGPLMFNGGPFTVPNPSSDTVYVIRKVDTPVVCESALMNCDVYALSVVIPDEFRNARETKNAVVRTVVQFSPGQAGPVASGFTSFEAYLYDGSDTELARSDAGSAGADHRSGFEMPLSQLPNGLYQLRVTANRGLGGSYTAEIGLERGSKSGDAIAAKEGGGLFIGAFTPLMLLGLLLGGLRGRLGLRRVLLATVGMAFCVAGQTAMTAAVPEILSLPAPDIEALLAADAGLPSPKPYRFGVSIPVRVTPSTYGRWQSSSDGGRIWRLRIEATDAHSLNFGFTRFQLPQGAQLSVSAPDGRDRHGPYVASHATAGQLWTPPVHGSAAVIELRLPAAAHAGLSLELTQVNYGFRSFNAEQTDPKALPCNIDVACPQGDEWRNEIRAVARILVSGVFACSGTMLNNSAQDFRPYFLTANHCFDASGFEAASTVVLWNFQKSVCGGSASASTGGVLDTNKAGDTQTGATMRANALYLTPGNPFVINSRPDFALIELSQTPPPEFKVYYSGWDRRDLAPVGVVGIHHPAAQDKSLSLTTRATIIGDVENTDDAALGSFKYFLKLEGWDQGTTQSGSSGSGLWNREHRLVANLTGGVNQTTCPHTGAVDYFRFFSAWNYSELPTRMLPPYLDPANSGVDVLDGADPNGIDLRQPSKQSSLTSANDTGTVAASRNGSGLLIGASSPLLLLALLFGAFLRKTNGSF